MDNLNLLRRVFVEREKTKEKVLNCITQYIKEHGYPPSVQEICEKTHLKSKASVHEYLRQLMMDGTIQSDHEGKARAIKVAGYSYINKKEENRLTVEKLVRISGVQNVIIEKNGIILYQGKAMGLDIPCLMKSTIHNILYKENEAVLQIS